MKLTIYTVVTGSYEDTEVVRAFEDRQDAETSWSHRGDRARAEELDFVPARQAMKTIDYTVGTQVEIV